MPQDGGRDVPTVSAVIQPHAGDFEWQHVGQECHRSVIPRLGVAANKDVVGARLGRWNDGKLVRLRTALVDGIVTDGRGKLAPSDEYLVGGIDRSRLQIDAQRLIGSNR